MMTLGNWNGRRRQYRQWCNNAVVYQNWQIWSIISGLWKRDARWPICYSGVWQLLRLNIYVMYDMYNVPGVTMMAWAPLILPVNCLSSPPYHPSCYRYYHFMDIVSSWYIILVETATWCHMILWCCWITPYILCYDTVQGKDKTMSCNDMIILYRRPLSDMVLLY